MYIAHIVFYKDIEKDNFTKGCDPQTSQLVWDTNFTLEFTDTNDLVDKLTNYITYHFDVKSEDFKAFVNNECDNYRFDYNQSEDGEGKRVDITEENPNGYLATYQFMVTRVMKEVRGFKFSELSN